MWTTTSPVRQNAGIETRSVCILRCRAISTFTSILYTCKTHNLTTNTAEQPFKLPSLPVNCQWSPSPSAALPGWPHSGCKSWGRAKNWRIWPYFTQHSPWNCNTKESSALSTTWANDRCVAIHTIKHGGAKPNWFQTTQTQQHIIHQTRGSHCLPTTLCRPWLFHFQSVSQALNPQASHWKIADWRKAWLRTCSWDLPPVQLREPTENAFGAFGRLLRTRVKFGDVRSLLVSRHRN